MLPNKYDQQVGYWFEGGTQLSSGQWQKLSIARLFMKNGDCFVLDEPTASLDSLAEYQFFNDLKKILMIKWAYLLHTDLLMQNSQITLWF